MREDSEHGGQPAIRQEPAHLTYRPDIDGLRAVAVLAVIGFHAFPSYVPGGFIGVDVFFVISGFLISTLIAQQLDRERFSVAEFYGRRIRRIFPALVVVLSASLVLGALVLTTDEYQRLGRQVAGGAGFVSNFMLWSESGYFDAAAEVKPLLHLWSLGIEEQYYIVWPVLLWVAWHRRLDRLVIAIVVCASSFGFSLITIQSDASAAFYSPLTRAWELMIGSVLAFVALGSMGYTTTSVDRLSAFSRRTMTSVARWSSRPLWCNVLSLLGCALLVCGFATITQARLFPGAWALLPTAGAAFLIMAGMRAWLNRVVLANAILVWIGLISFPIYLWHWPLLTFARIIEGGVPTREIRAGAVLCSIALAWATYRWIEKPIRFKGWPLRRVGLALTVAMIVMGCAGFAVPSLDSLEWRAAAAPPITNEGDTAPSSMRDYARRTFRDCPDLMSPVGSSLGFCVQSQQSGVSTIGVIGDSHAEDLFVGLAAALPEKNVMLLVRDGLPTQSVSAFDDAFRYLLSDRDIGTVVLAAYWFGRVGALSPERGPGRQLGVTVAALVAAGKTVYISDDVPTFSFYPEKCKYARRFSQNNCLEVRGFDLQRRQGYSPALDVLERITPGVKVLRTADYFCGSSSCSMARDGKLLYRDSHHLTVNGAMYLGRRLVESYPALRE